MDCSITKNFIKEYSRLCTFNDAYYEYRCVNCPLSKLRDNRLSLLCVSTVLENIDEAIDIVQKWSDENPVKTNQTEFLKLFPKTALKPDGTIYIYPCIIDTEYPFYAICSRNLGDESCEDCSRRYWNTEVE